MSSLTQISSLVRYLNQDGICLTPLLVVLISLRQIASYLCFLLVLLHKGRFCNGCITKQCLKNSLYSKCNIMIFFQNYSVMKDESNKNINVFCHVLHYINFFMKGKLKKYPPLSTVVAPFADDQSSLIKYISDQMIWKQSELLAWSSDDLVDAKLFFPFPLWFKSTRFSFLF